MANSFVEEKFPYTNHLLDNCWEFYFEDDLWTRFLVKSATLPFDRFKAEKNSVGEAYYSGIEFTGDVTIEFYETADFKVKNFFDAWRKNIINSNNEFIAYPKGTVKGSKEDKAHKRGMLVLQKFEPDSTKDVQIVVKAVTKELVEQLFKQKDNISAYQASYLEKEVMRDVRDVIRQFDVQEYNNDFYSVIVQREILNNILLQTAANTAARWKSIVGVIEQPDPPPYIPTFFTPNMKPFSIQRKEPANTFDTSDTGETQNEQKVQVDEQTQDQDFKLEAIAQKVEQQILKEKIKTNKLSNAKTYVFQNMKFLGFQPLNFSYDQGNPVVMSASFAVDAIKDSAT